MARLEPPEQVSTALRNLAEQIEQSRRNEWRPLYSDLILLLDRVDNGVSAWESDPRVADFLATVRDEIEEVLARRGVQAMVCPEDTFDVSRQRAVKISPTDDPAQDRRVAAVIRRGYEQEGYVIRPEEVVVSRYTKPEEPRTDGQP